MALINFKGVWVITVQPGQRRKWTLWMQAVSATNLNQSKGSCTDSGSLSSEKSLLLPCLFNVYAEYIMRNAGLDEAQAGIKIVGRNIDDLRYADDTTLMAESEEEVKHLLIKVKEESERAGLKLNIQKTKIMVSGPI